MFSLVTSAVFRWQLEGGTVVWKIVLCGDTWQGIAQTPFSHDVMRSTLTAIMVLWAAV